MDQDLIKLLEESGFTDKEARVYLALLELSEGNVTQIARLTQLKRSIIYVILEGLIKRNYVNEIPEKKINTYRPIEPSMILLEIKKKARNFSEMLPLLQTLHNKGIKKPKITYFETKEGILRVWNKISYAKEQFFISSYARIEEVFPGAVAKWLDEKEKGLVNSYGRHLLPDKQSEKLLTKHLVDIGDEVRTSSLFNDINMDFALFDSSLAITSFEENPFIVVIESEELVKSIKPLFEIAWAQAKPLE